jgi:hypothetical protein
MRMPDEGALPSGAVRDFVWLLFHFYRQAHRPTLREISDRIKKSDLPGTASTETIRRMLHGTTVPAHWGTVDAVLVVLSELAGKSPDSTLVYHDEERTARKHLERLWHEALDNPTPHYEQRVASYEPPPAPWEDDSPGSYSDEPPF